jgi:TolA-binding protein
MRKSVWIIIGALLLVAALAGAGAWWMLTPHTAAAQLAYALKLEDKLAKTPGGPVFPAVAREFAATIAAFEKVETGYGKVPEAGQAWQHIAGLYEKIGKDDEKALGALGHLVRDYPSVEIGGAALVDQARILRRQAETAKAKGAASMPADDPGTEEAASRPAGPGVELFRRALATLDDYRKKFPTGPKADAALMESGRIWQDGLGRPLIHAIDTFTQFIREYPASPDYPEAVFRLATLMEQIKEDTKALELYSELLDKFPQCPWADRAQLARGKLLADKLGKPDEAAKDFEKVSARNPEGDMGDEARSRAESARQQEAQRQSDDYAKKRYGEGGGGGRGGPVDTLADKPVPPEAHYKIFAEQNLNVQRYDMDVTLTPGEHRLAVAGTLALVNRGKDKDEILLMLSPGMKVSAVTVNGVAAKSERQAQTWRIALAKPLAKDAAATIQFACAGRFAAPRPLPPGAGVGGGVSKPGTTRPAEGTGASAATAPMATREGGVAEVFDPQTAIGEQDGYALSGGPWYPSNVIGDTFLATVRYHISSSAELVATGLPLERIRGLGGAGGEFTFQTKRPVMGLYFAYGDYVVGQEERHGIQYATCLRRANAGRSKEFIDAAARILELYADRFGPYPYERLTIVETPLPPFLGGVGPAGLMFLHQTLVGQNQVPTNLLAHELAHQWFGNLVPINMLTPGYNQWLSEGFATYADALFTEAGEGPAALAHHMERYDQLYFTNLVVMHRVSSIRATVPGTAAYRPVVYEKGAIVLHSLRKVLGDEKFFALMKQYVAKNADRPSTVEDFTTLAQAVYGQDLTWFFKTWLDQTSFAHYKLAEVNVHAASAATSPGGAAVGTGNWNVSMHILQPEETLKMPVDLTIWDDVGHRYVQRDIWVDKADNPEVVICEFEPKHMALDEGNWILKRPGPDYVWPVEKPEPAK